MIIKHLRRISGQLMILHSFDLSAWQTQNPDLLSSDMIDSTQTLFAGVYPRKFA
jgi:hypothetical protein